eukprot:TRINITY_DN1730_c0_g1_i2.p1 TRINITY_DN1730_c0_g1~~TRINITY_DN1730_c0_g1_i2.p1  ORF type:complete len:687 (-),score=60.20 TRINITY_DN1730_c0_g1_i2:4230-6290(-)
MSTNMWSYLQSFVSSTDEQKEQEIVNSKNNSILPQEGLGQALAPAPTAPAQTHFRHQRDSFEVLQKVMEAQNKQNKRTRFRGFIGGSSQGKNEEVSGLGLLLGESTLSPRTIQHNEDKSNNSNSRDEISLDQTKNVTNERTPSKTILSGDSKLSNQSNSVIVAQNGQMRAMRSDADILEGLMASLQEEKQRQSQIAHQENLQSFIPEDQPQYFQRQRSQRNSIQIPTHSYRQQDQSMMNRHTSIDFLRQHDPEIDEIRRINSMQDEGIWQQGPPVEIQDLDLPPAVQSFLQDRKDLQMRQQYYEELPPDFDNRSVISETRSMPDIKRPESPVARPPLGTHISRTYRSASSNLVSMMVTRMESRSEYERTMMLARCASTANSPQLKREIQFSDKVQYINLKGPTGMYVPDTYPSSSRAPSIAASQTRIQSIKESEQELSEGLSEATLKAESQKSLENAEENLKELIQPLENDNLGYSKQVPTQNSQITLETENLQQQNRNQERFSFKKARRPSQTSEDSISAMSETKYQEILNSWKAKQRESIKRSQRQHSRRSGRARPPTSVSLPVEENITKADWVNLRSGLSIPEAQEVFMRLQEDDLQSVQSEPLVKGSKIGSTENYDSNIKSKDSQSLSRERSLLQKIEEGRGEDINIYPDIQVGISGAVSLSLTELTNGGNTSISDNTLVHY